MFCKICGKEIPDGKELCDDCASRNQSYQQPNNSTYTQQPNQGTVVNNNYQANTNPQAKSKLCAGLLGIFLGSFGVHNFYLGFYGKAIAQLLITVLSCFLLAPVSATWALIEGIMILCGSMNTDANGMQLKD